MINIYIHIYNETLHASGLYTTRITHRMRIGALAAESGRRRGIDVSEAGCRRHRVALRSGSQRQRKRRSLCEDGIGTNRFQPGSRGKLDQSDRSQKEEADVRRHPTDVIGSAPAVALTAGPRASAPRILTQPSRGAPTAAECLATRHLRGRPTMLERGSERESLIRYCVPFFKSNKLHS